MLLTASGTNGAYRVSLALFTVTAGVNLQAPLYAAYAQRAGMGATASALVFCCYAASLLPCLLLLGGLSDRIGRSLALMISLGFALAAALLMAIHGSFGTLIVARLLQGLSVGLSFSAGAAWMRELVTPARAAHLTTASTAAGFGFGPVITFLILEIWPQAGAAGATPFSYWAHPLLAAVSALLLIGIPHPHDRNLHDRAPTHHSPPLATLPLLPPGTWPAGLAIFIGWASAGLIIGVLQRALRDFGLDHWAGLCIFCVTVAGFLMQPMAQRIGPDRSVRLGILILPLAFLLIAIGVHFGWLVPLMLGAALNGASSFGFAYLGGLRIFQTAAQDSPRGSQGGSQGGSHGGSHGSSQARAAAGYFLWIYLGFSLPVLGGGALADWIGMTKMLIVFGSVIVVLCALAFVGLARRRRPAPAS